MYIFPAYNENTKYRMVCYRKSSIFLYFFKLHELGTTNSVQVRVNTPLQLAAHAPESGVGLSNRWIMVVRSYSPLPANQELPLPLR